MKNRNNRKTYELVVKELQTLIAVGYIITVGIEMLFNYQKYSDFKINIFDYADVFDFLIAPFSDFYILLFVTLSIAMVFALVKLDGLWRDKWPLSYSIANLRQDKKAWFKKYRVVLFSISCLIYLYSSADYYGKYVKRKILSSDNISIRLMESETISGKFIGKTKDVIFIYKDYHVSALPISTAVVEILLNQKVHH